MPRLGRCLGRLAGSSISSAKALVNCSSQKLIYPSWTLIGLCPLAAMTIARGMSNASHRVIAVRRISCGIALGTPVLLAGLNAPAANAQSCYRERMKVSNDNVCLLPLSTIGSRCGWFLLTGDGAPGLRSSEGCPALVSAVLLF